MKSKIKLKNSLNNKKNLYTCETWKETLKKRETRVLLRAERVELCKSREENETKSREKSFRKFQFEGDSPFLIIKNRYKLKVLHVDHFDSLNGLWEGQSASHTSLLLPVLLTQNVSSPSRPWIRLTHPLKLPSYVLCVSTYCFIIHESHQGKKW